MLYFYKNNIFIMKCVLGIQHNKNHAMRINSQNNSYQHNEFAKLDLEAAELRNKICSISGSLLPEVERG